MALFQKDITKEALQAFTSQPSEFNAWQSRQQALPYQASPVEDMLNRSNLVDWLRQIAPGQVSDIKNQYLQDFLRRAQKGPAWMREAAKNIQSLPLGGYSQSRKEALRMARASDPELAQKTLEILPSKAPLKKRAAQGVGVVAGDVMSDGARNIWWFLNAPQALMQLSQLQGLHSATDELRTRKEFAGVIPEGPYGLMRGRNLRLAATMPTIALLSASIGNIGRPKGYKAVLPSESDPRKSDSPIAESVSRYFLGRTGRLLPYNEFVKERPDVSKDEYQRYKAYLFDQKSDLNPLDDGKINLLGALKANVRGIHGPEVNFMGKSVPLATGILPAIAGVAGASYGLRRGARARLNAVDGLKKTAAMRNTIEDLNQELRQTRGKMKAGKASVEDLAAVESQINLTKADLEKIDRVNQAVVAGNVGAYGLGAGALTAVTGQGLELLRRAMGSDD